MWCLFGPSCSLICRQSKRTFQKCRGIRWSLRGAVYQPLSNWHGYQPQFSYTRSLSKSTSRLESLLKVIVTPVVSVVNILSLISLIGWTGPTRRIHTQLHSSYRGRLIFKFPEGSEVFNVFIRSFHSAFSRFLTWKGPRKANKIIFWTLS